MCNYPDYVGFAHWHYRRSQFPLYQIVWPNNDGYYPWSPGATNAFREWQPVRMERRSDRSREASATLSYCACLEW